MQFSVYLKGSDLSGVAPHKSSRGLARAAVAAGIAVACGQNAIQLTTSRTWKQVKAFLRPATPADCQLLNEPGYHSLPYTYPLPYDVLRHYQTVRV